MIIVVLGNITKFVWIKKPQVSLEEEVEVKPKVLALSDRDKSSISTMRPCQGVGCVLMQEERYSTLFIKSTKEA